MEPLLQVVFVRKQKGQNNVKLGDSEFAAASLFIVERNKLEFRDGSQERGSKIQRRGRASMRQLMQNRNDIEEKRYEEPGNIGERKRQPPKEKIGCQGFLFKREIGPRHLKTT